MMTTASWSFGKYQNRGSGFLSAFIRMIMLASSRCCSSACGMATLFRSIQSGWSRRRIAVEKIIGADRRYPVALLSDPGRVALAGVDDGARQVEGEGGGLPAVRPHAAQGDGRVRGRGGGRRIERCQGGGALQGVAVGRAVELDRLPDDAGPRIGGRVDQQVAFRQGRPESRSTRAARPAACPAAWRSGCRRR